MPGLTSPFPAEAALPLPPAFHTTTGSDNPSSSSTLRFVLNKKKIALAAGSFDPDLTLLEYLRTEQGLTGTKLGCAEGGCGACTVVLGKIRKKLTGSPSSSDQDGQGSTHYEYKAVNACLLPMVAIHGGHVLTVEGIGTSEDPHPVQERIAKLFGSQCGFVSAALEVIVGVILI
jgi:xanthine dehydrogenase/oxidase